jgi:hypothetical protein
MVKKAPRPDAHIARLADALRDTWVPAMGIEPWLRRRVARFTRLVQSEGWSWDDIGQAMTQAGIVYGSGKPWTGGLLSRKAARLRSQARQQPRQDVGAVPPPTMVQPMPPSFGGPVTLPRMVEGEPATDAAIYFAPASLPNRQDAGQPAPMRAEPVPPAPIAASRTEDEVEAVLRRLRGDDDSSTE